MAIIEGSLASGGHGRPTENCPCGAESEYFEGQIERIYWNILAGADTGVFYCAELRSIGRTPELSGAALVKVVGF